MTAFRTVGGFTLIGFFHEGSEPVARFELSETLKGKARINNVPVSLTCDGLALLASKSDDLEERNFLSAIRDALDHLRSIVQAYQSILGDLNKGQMTVNKVVDGFDLGDSHRKVLDALDPYWIDSN